MKSLFKRGLRNLLAGNFELIARRSAELVQERVAEPQRRVGDERLPSWVSAPTSGAIYQLSVSEYVTALFDGSGRIEISASDPFDTVEVPLVAPELCDAVTVQTDGSTRELSFDDGFSYPPVVWQSIDVEPTTTATVTVTVDAADASVNPVSRVLDRLRDSVDVSPKVGTPAVVPTERNPPVVLISLDSVRYDCREQLQPLLDELGPSTVVPSEPRTQGTWTPPSHGSMFTGTHPGRHGYVGTGKAPGDRRPIDPELTTVPSLLADHGYKNSAIVSHGRLQPEYGFGRGFHRFVHDGMDFEDWVSRDHDARETVNTVIDWIDSDVARRNHSLFYFLHVFDPHLPYLPPLDLLDQNRVDLSDPQAYGSAVNEITAAGDYIDLCGVDHDVDPELVDRMRRYYDRSVTYTGRQIARLVRHLKTVGLFDDALIIVTGDHGEEWGERGFFLHTSLYDENVRPFMAVKPPASADWPVRDAVDTVDFLPTVASLVGAAVPDRCEGVPLQRGPTPDRDRITERIYPRWYSVAVERDGRKGIFTYESDYPDRPIAETVESGPRLAEFYRLTDVRAGEYGEASFDDDVRDDLRARAEAFVTTRPTARTTSGTRAPLPPETEEQLAKLGYK